MASARELPVSGSSRTLELILPRALREALTHLGGMALLAARIGPALFRGRFEGRLLVAQLEQIGVRSLSIVTLTATFTGMVLALQMGSSLTTFGAKIFVSRVVGLSLIRELGPVLTALMIAGRVGAGITAELGSMRVTEQIDAIRALGADPIRKLVVPRILARHDHAAAAHGHRRRARRRRRVLHQRNRAACRRRLLLHLAAAIHDARGHLLGLAKTAFFAFFIGLVACYNGLNAEGGADGVGRATTATVVAASITVLVSDFFLTKLFLLAVSTEPFVRCRGLVKRFDGRRVLRSPRSRRPPRRDLGHSRRQRLGQERLIEAHERPPPARRRRGDRGRRRDRDADGGGAAAGPPQNRHALPGRRALRLADGRGERRVSAARAPRVGRRTRSRRGSPRSSPRWISPAARRATRRS